MEAFDEVFKTAYIGFWVPSILTCFAVVWQVVFRGSYLQLFGWFVAFMIDIAVVLIFRQITGKFVAAENELNEERELFTKKFKCPCNSGEDEFHVLKKEQILANLNLMRKYYLYLAVFYACMALIFLVVIILFFVIDDEEETTKMMI